MFIGSYLENNFTYRKLLDYPFYGGFTVDVQRNDEAIKDKRRWEKFTHPYYRRKLPVATSQTESRRLQNNPMLLISTFSASSLLENFLLRLLFYSSLRFSHEGIFFVKSGIIRMTFSLYSLVSCTMCHKIYFIMMEQQILICLWLVVVDVLMTRDSNSKLDSNFFRLLFHQEFHEIWLFVFWSTHANIETSINFEGFQSLSNNSV